MTTIDLRDEAEFTVEGMVAAAQASGAESPEVVLTPEQWGRLVSEMSETKMIGCTIRWPPGHRVHEIRLRVG
jgi:hypothetical protein